MKKAKPNNPVFDAAYFKENYANYQLQNPPYKSKAVLRLISKYKPQGKLLDVGCAYCAFLRVAKDQGYSVQGCDVGAEVVRASSKNFKLKQSGITDLKYKKGEFDIITVLDVIEHVKDYGLAFSELKRVMNDDGIVVFVMPVYDGLVGKLVGMVDKDQTHVNKLGREDWIKILSKEFDVIQWRGVFRYFLFKKIYLNLHSEIFRRYAPAIIVVCKKK